MISRVTTFTGISLPILGTCLVTRVKNYISSITQSVASIELGTAIILAVVSFALLVGVAAYGCYPRPGADDEFQFMLTLACVCGFAFIFLLLIVTPSTWWYESESDRCAYTWNESRRWMIRERNNASTSMSRAVAPLRPPFRPKRPALPQARIMPKASCLCVRFTATGPGVIRKPVSSRSVR